MKPLPRFAPESEAYWEGCRRGELRLQHCASCSAVHFPPRRYCAGCLGDSMEWRPASGRGTVRSFTVMRHPPSPAFAGDVPYAVGLVELEEGPTMMGGLRSCSLDDLFVGMRVEIEFEKRSDEIYIPHFHTIPAERREVG